MDKTFELLAISPWLGPSLQPTDKTPRVSPTQAREHVGQAVVVAGRVAEVAVHEKLVYLNLDKPFPDTPFMAVVFAAKAGQFGNLLELKGRDVEVSGKVILFRERAEIVVESKNQLKVL